MTATLRGTTFGDNRMTISKGANRGNVFFALPHLWDGKKVRGTHIDIGVDREELKKALHEELGWFVVEKSDLPTPVYRDLEGGYVEVEDSEWGSGVVKREDAQGFWAEAHVHIALALYAESLPKVDPRVETLVDVLMDVANVTSPHAATKLAEALIASGKVEVK